MMEYARHNFSELVSDTLDSIGYSRDIILNRRYNYQRATKTINNNLFQDGHLSCIQAGSKGEGITSFHESDVDRMLVFNDAVCLEPKCRIFVPMNTTSFETEQEHTAPGYTKLRVRRLVTGLHVNARIIINSLVRTGTGSYLSSETFFRNVVLNKMVNNMLPKQGPSSPSRNAGIMQDLVYAFRCHCPSILAKWLERKRTNDWPAEHTVRTISTLEAHVVPVGFKLSLEELMEWRICYTLAELSLMHSFNDTQTKVYILLKHIAKSVLKQVSGAVTSYVMKNIIFWVSELTPSKYFTSELLIDRLVQSIILLSKFLKHGHVPSYMIPERNLVLGKLPKHQSASLLILLGQLIEEGGSMLLRCHKLRLAMLKMYKTPEDAKQEGLDRDGIERTELMSTTTISLFLIKPKFESRGYVMPVGKQSVNCEGPKSISREDCNETNESSFENVNDLCGALERQVITDPDELELLQWGKTVGNSAWKKLKKTIPTL